MNALIKTLKSRKVQEINGVKFRTLNSESLGAATELEVEVIDNDFTETDDPEEKPQKVKGNAKVKIWCLNPKTPKKKDCTVMVDKHREHDRKFVRIIAQKVIKPTIDSLLKGEGTANLLKTPHEKTIGKAEVIVLEDHKCDMCQMKFAKEHGLQVHKGRMHSEKKRKHMGTEKDKVICEVCKYTGGSTDELQMHMSTMHSEPSFKCDNCNYAGVSTGEVKNHMLLMHSESATEKVHDVEEGTSCIELRRDKTKCMFCDYKNIDESDLKRHIRDEHRESKSPSTSPPKKKTRQEAYALVEDIINGITQGLNLEDEMDQGDKEDEYEKELKVENEDELAKRSRLQDEKILLKQKKIEEKEMLVLEEQRKAKYDELQDKKRKREEKSKDTVKDNLKKTEIQCDDHRIPEKYRKLFNLKGVNIDDLRLMETGGGGKCGAYCVSLHISSSTTLATEIRENINCHIVDNWVEFEESFQYPCSLKVGSGNRSFKNNKELRAFLLVDPEAPSMWMTHACLQAVSNMQDMTINILTKGVPTATSTCIRCPPNTNFDSVSELKKHEENVHKRFETEEEKEGRLLNSRWTTLKPSSKHAEQERKVKTPDMYVMHEDNIHYSLMVHKSHDLFKRLSTPQTSSLKSLVTSEIRNSEIKEPLNLESSGESDIKKEVAKLRSKVKLMESEQNNTLEEMRTMRVKMEKLVNENRTLQDFKDLSEGKDLKCDKCSLTFRSREDMKIHMDIEHPKEEIVFECINCGFKTNCETSLKKHIENHKVLRIKCRKCGAFCETEELLRDHLKIVHPRKSTVITNEQSQHEHIHCNAPRCSEEEIQIPTQNVNIRESRFVCRDCKEAFESKWQLMNHRRDKHPSNKMCFYDAENKCSFSADQCWYKHKEAMKQTYSDARPNSQQTKELKCFTCQNKFANIPSLMEHRKQTHIETVKPCTKYVEGKCDRGQKCWYRHESDEDFHVAQKTLNQP